jgi:hypothetical protein
VLAYILEAHADDAWQMGQPRAIPNHTSLEDRAAACAHLVRDYSIRLPCVLDAVTTGCGDPAHGARCGKPNLERLYGAWPLRFLVFCPRTGSLLHKGMPKGDSMDFDDIDRALAAWAQVYGTPEQRRIADENIAEIHSRLA